MQQSCHAMDCKMFTACSVLCTKGERQKNTKRRKAFSYLLPSMPKAGWRIIFVFPISAEEHKYIESFSLNKKCLMYKTNIEMLLVLIMLCLTSFWVSVYISRHS